MEKFGLFLSQHLVALIAMEDAKIGPKESVTVKACLHWRFYLDENVGVLATVSMFVAMDVYDSQGKQRN